MRFFDINVNRTITDDDCGKTAPVLVRKCGKTLGRYFMLSGFQ